MNGKDASRVRNSLSTLKRVERYAVLMYYADELTLAEISVVLGIALPEVTQIIDKFRETAAEIMATAEPLSASPLATTI